MRNHLLISGVSLIAAAVLVAPAWPVEFPGPKPGQATARLEKEQVTLENGAISATWQVSAAKPWLSLVKVVDRLSGTTFSADRAVPFGITLGDGTRTAGCLLRPAASLTSERLPAQPNAIRLADRIPGWKAAVSLVSVDGTIRVDWQAVLRDDSNYLRQQLTLHALKKDLTAKEITGLRLPAAKDARVEGVVEGSPLVSGNLFLGCEHPMAANRVEQRVATCSADVFQLLKAGQSCMRSFVIGVAPPGQMRRAFLYYLERERPRPYQPFLHYNSWYDIAWGDRKMNEGQCLAVIDLYGRELVEKRGVKLDSLVFDDGWDDNKTLWRFHSGFPHGFTPLQAAAQKYKTSVGVWLSPWGGYGQAQKERLDYGKSQGFETNKRGFSLAGPKYYGRFSEVCAEMVKKYGVNYFKFDGIAQGISSGGAGAEFAADVDGLLRLLIDLRRMRPDLFVNVTTGTWPSPFWLLYADSIWRNGGDMGFFGPGSRRQQWITYRDMIEYEWIVRRGPLYPLNSLMTQGIAQARLGDASKLGEDLNELKQEVRSFFASGTQLQELYVTPQMLTPGMWDALAEGAAWSRKNADVLVDVHWVGGDPGKREAYGFAAWSPRQGMLALRNPSDAPGSIQIDVAKALELPPGSVQQYRLVSPWKDDSQRKPLSLRAGQAHTFALAPFELLVFDALPVR